MRNKRKQENNKVIRSTWSVIQIKQEENQEEIYY
jgi:hypothetical protein